MIRAARTACAQWVGSFCIVAFLACITTLPAAGAPEQDNPGELAQQILKATGVSGGLIVHLGCGDGRLTAALRASESFLVHGLDADANQVKVAREHIQALGLYGKVSAEHWTDEQLPYVDNLVNLLVIHNVGKTPMAEIMRVLRPLGVAYIWSGSQWAKTIKPWPKAIDEWTHFLHGPDNNAVAQDSAVGPPKYMQWVADPLYCRSHEYNPSVSALVSARGRLFYILDEGPTGIIDERFPERWSLIARDAFNGVFLWKQTLPDWGWPQWQKDEFTGRLGTVGPQRIKVPPTLTRRLVADEDRVYVTLGFHAPVTKIDAGTGATVRVFAGTENADEILYSQGTLLVCARTLSPEQPKGPTEDSIVAVNADTGQILWKKESLQVSPLSLAVDVGRVVFEDRSDLVCLDLMTGEKIWQMSGGAETGNKSGSSRDGWLANVSQTLVIHEGVVFVLRRDLAAFSLETGKLLWTSAGGAGAGGLGSPPDLFVAAGLVWAGAKLQGHDLLTGQVEQSVDIMHLLSEGHHPRCYRSKATDSYLILPKRGAEFIDLQGGGNHMRHDWLRGPCQYGVLPCNGLLYAPPHQCNCYPGVKLTGFNALAAQKSSSTIDQESSPRLERGPAYRPMQNPASTPVDLNDWPTYRYDHARSGSVKAQVPADLTPLWQTQLGGKLSQPVIFEGKLLVASVETHRILCIDANNGEPLWSFIAGGRVDGPPTVYRGLALFGSSDGWVYCVRISDGALVWRFRAAPESRRVVALGEVESAWPVHGSVLVQNDVAYVNAGRSTFLDGGIYVYALDPATGRLLHEDHLEGPYPDITQPEGTAWNMDGATSEVLVGDGEFVYLRQVKWDGGLNRQSTPLLTERGRNVGGGAKQVGQHLYATSDLLDDSGFNRVYWMYSDTWSGRCKKSPGAAQVLVFDSKFTYGAMPFTANTAGMPGFFPASGCVQLFANANNNHMQTNDSAKTRRSASAAPVPGEWSVTVPIMIRAMLLADETLFIVGPPDVLDSKDPLAALEGREGSVLWAVSTVDGTKIAERLLPSVPTFDGLVSAQGRLYLSTTDGAVICLGAEY